MTVPAPSRAGRQRVLAVLAKGCQAVAIFLSMPAMLFLALLVGAVPSDGCPTPADGCGDDRGPIALRLVVVVTVGVALLGLGRLLSRRSQPRFRQPPGWPDPPDGWRPSPGWTPSPDWPEPPAGWSFWA